MTLRDTLLSARTPEMGVEFMRNIGSTAPREMFIIRLDNDMQGFVSAAVALFEHARKNIDQAYGDDHPLTQSFRERNDAIRDLPEAKFIRDLRNFSSHSGQLPYTLHTFHNPPSGLVTLSVEELFQRSSRWSGPTKAYLRAAAPALDPLEPVTVYSRATEELYAWLFEEWPKHHQSERDSHAALASEFTRTITDGRFDDPEEWQAFAAEGFARSMAAQEGETQEP